MARRSPALLLLAIPGLLALPPAVGAQVFGEAARTEFFGGLGVRAFYARINKTRRNADGSRVYINALPVSVVYGLRPRLSLIGIFPVVTRTFEGALEGRRVSDTKRGIGDITLFAKYRFYKRDAGSSSRQLAFQWGLKLPAGKNDSKDARGLRLPPPLQLGSGSVDYRFVLVFSEARHRWVFTGDVGYELKTEANHFEFGDVFTYDLAAKFRVRPSRYRDKYPVRDLFVFVELNGNAVQKARNRGRETENSGGEELFIAPGFQFFALENMLWETGVQIPVLEELRGDQLGTDLNFRTGLRWILAF